ncbi:MAG: 4Fe-4S dicluster domain-containing protein [Candidatus Riflebacteria bacterium]|nr:4Fe-4S dicluster domain-containing protein [Candidatus Riflebacteria bacterium]
MKKQEDMSSSPARRRSARSIHRRDFLRGAASLLALVASGGCGSDRLAAITQRHLKQLTRPELKETLERLERQYEAKYGVKFSVHSTPPREETLYAYALDLSRCVGCRRCVKACVKENNSSREGGQTSAHNMPIEWIRVLEMAKDRGVDVTHSTAYYEPAKVPREGHFYMPVQCHQCENPSCVKVCPVEATWKERDGIVVIDYDWCIGCRYCMVACPYGARRFNWAEPHLPKDQVNPHTHLLGNRPRYRGIVEKCTFCIQRVRNGRYPACVEICPVGARKFGNRLDPEGEIRQILERKRIFVFKEEINTLPKFYYFYGI